MHTPTFSEDNIEDVLKRAFEPPDEGVETFSYDLDTTNVDLTDESQEASLVRDDARRDGVVVPELPDYPGVAPESAFDSNPVEDAKSELLRAFSGQFDFGTIDIDEIERDRFYRCGLHDADMYYDVRVPGFEEVTCRVVIPTVSQSEATLLALDAWRDAGAIGTNNIQTLHGFQLLTVWLMVRAFNGKPTDWYAAAEEEAGGSLTYRKLCKVLNVPEVVDSLRALGEIRWKILTSAVLIADYKHQLCLEALRSRRVFTTAGSA